MAGAPEGLDAGIKKRGVTAAFSVE